MAASNTNCAHKELPHHAKGMCRDCYRKQKVQDHRNSILDLKSKITGVVPQHPVAPDATTTALDDLLKAVQAPVPSRVLNTFDSAVVDHCVKALIACQMDSSKAVNLIAAHETDAVKKEMIEILKNDPRIKSQLHYDLSVLGLDEESKKKFLATMTHWLYNEADPRLRATAARVFMKAFISEKIEERHIEDLTIRDLDEGVKAMLSEAPKYDEPDETIH